MAGWIGVADLVARAAPVASRQEQRRPVEKARLSVISDARSDAREAARARDLGRRSGSRRQSECLFEWFDHEVAAFDLGGGVGTGDLVHVR
jgi:hypothetical protein